jgi:hypothetical protein
MLQPLRTAVPCDGGVVITIDVQSRAPQVVESLTVTGIESGPSPAQTRKPVSLTASVAQTSTDTVAVSQQAVGLRLLQIEYWNVTTPVKRPVGGVYTMLQPLRTAEPWAGGVVIVIDEQSSVPQEVESLTVTGIESGAPPTQTRKPVTSLAVVAQTSTDTVAVSQQAGHELLQIE